MQLYSTQNSFVSEAPQQQQALLNTHCSEYIVTQTYVAVHTHQLTVHFTQTPKLHTEQKLHLTRLSTTIVA